MKKIILIGILAIILSLTMAVQPALAYQRIIPQSPSQGKYDTLTCSRCGKPLNGNAGEQSPVARALGLTICVECFFQMLYGNDTTNVTSVAQLGTDGKVLASQLPDGLPSAAAWGSITGNITSQTDLNSALSGIHSHSNMTILDAVTESFTTSLKSSYDWLVTNITSSWKTTVDNHVNSTHAPSDAQKNSDITKAEIEAKLTGEIASHTHAGGGDGESVVVMSGDVANTTTTLANATGMTFNAAANSEYIIEGFVLWNASATTVGIKLSATASGSPTIQSGHFVSDAVNGTPDTSSWNANDVVVTTSGSAFTTYNHGELHAILKTSGSTSTWQLRFAAETTGTITMKTGSVLRIRKVV